LVGRNREFASIGVKIQKTSVDVQSLKVGERLTWVAHCCFFWVVYRYTFNVQQKKHPGWQGFNIMFQNSKEKSLVGYGIVYVRLGPCPLPVFVTASVAKIPVKIVRGGTILG
jgi:hypothetical protein